MQFKKFIVSATAAAVSIAALATLASAGEITETYDHATGATTYTFASLYDAGNVDGNGRTVYNSDVTSPDGKLVIHSNNAGFSVNSNGEIVLNGSETANNRGYNKVLSSNSYVTYTAACEGTVAYTGSSDIGNYVDGTYGNYNSDVSTKISANNVFMFSRRKPDNKVTPVTFTPTTTQVTYGFGVKLDEVINKTVSVQYTDAKGGGTATKSLSGLFGDTTVAGTGEAMFAVQFTDVPSTTTITNVELIDTVSSSVTE